MLGDVHSFNPDFLIILGDFDGRSNNWWVSDTQTSEGSRTDSLTTSYSFRQLISRPRRILKKFSSCIDLIFTDQPSFIKDSDNPPSNHPNYHNEIMHCKIDLNIIYPPPPPPHSLIWDKYGILKELIYHLLGKLLKWLIGDLCS